MKNLLLSIVTFLVSITPAVSQIRPPATGGGGAATLPLGQPGQMPIFAAAGSNVVSGALGRKVGYGFSGDSFFFSEGDSMMDNFAVTETNTPVGRLFANHAQSGWFYRTNAAGAGNTTDTIFDRLPDLVAQKGSGSTNNILVAWMGVNNLLAGESAETVWGKAKGISNYVKRAVTTNSFKLVLHTITSDTSLVGNGAYEWERIKLNNLICDYADTMGYQVANAAAGLPAPPNPGLYADNIHFNAAGNTGDAWIINETLQRGWGGIYPRNASDTLRFITEAMLYLSDTTYGNATTTYHGLAPKLTGLASQNLDGTGNYAWPGRPLTNGIGTKTRLLFDGDDILRGEGGTNSISVIITNFLNASTFTNWTLFTNISIASQRIDWSYTTNWAAYIAPLATAGGTNLMVVHELGLHNVKAGMTADAYMVAWNFYMDTAHGIGIQVCATTIPWHAEYSSEQLQVREEINLQIRRSVRWDDLLDLDALIPPPPDYYWYNNQAYQLSDFGRRIVARELAYLIESPRYSHWPRVASKPGRNDLGHSGSNYRGIPYARKISAAPYPNEIVEVTGGDGAARYFLSGNYDFLFKSGSGDFTSPSAAANTYLRFTPTNIFAQKAFVQPINAVGALSIDWSASNTHTKTIAANSTFTFTGAAAGQWITVAVTASGAYTTTWPTVTWAAGAAPTQTASKTDFYTFFFDGTTYFGSASQNY